MEKVKQVLQKLVYSPYFSMVLGIVLVLCGILELYETVLEDFMGLDVKSHHGLIIFGIGQILKSLVDISEGTEGLVVAKITEKVSEEIKDFEKTEQ